MGLFHSLYVLHIKLLSINTLNIANLSNTEHFLSNTQILLSNTTKLANTQRLLPWPGGTPVPAFASVL